MEQKEIKLETATQISYDLSQEELKKMYISLALSMYDHLRHPNYDERKLLQLLRADFKRFLTDTQLLMEQLPNNPRLHEIFIFFQNHNGYLKQITQELEKDA